MAVLNVILMNKLERQKALLARPETAMVEQNHEESWHNQSSSETNISETDTSETEAEIAKGRAKGLAGGRAKGLAGVKANQNGLLEAKTEQETLVEVMWQIVKGERPILIPPAFFQRANVSEDGAELQKHSAKRKIWCPGHWSKGHWKLLGQRPKRRGPYKAKWAAKLWGATPERDSRKECNEYSDQWLRHKEMAAKSAMLCSTRRKNAAPHKMPVKQKGMAARKKLEAARKPASQKAKSCQDPRSCQEKAGDWEAARNELEAATNTKTYVKGRPKERQHVRYRVQQKKASHKKAAQEKARLGEIAKRCGCVLTDVN